jgi:hypothetical protein
MRYFILFLAFACCALGCGPNLGRVKGRVVENGQPVSIDGQAAIMFYLIGEDGKPNPSKSYPMPLSTDGSFELVASGGAISPGTYLVSREVNAAKSPTGLGRLKGRFTYPNSKLRQEIKAGANDVTIDLAKPGP